MILHKFLNILDFNTKGRWLKMTDEQYIDIAIESASKNKNLYGDLNGATMYVSCEPCMMCMGAILYEEFSKVVYAATLQDSNDNYCPEMITDIDELAKYSKDKIEIIKELHRDKAVEVLKMRGE